MQRPWLDFDAHSGRAEDGELEVSIKFNATWRFLAILAVAILLAALVTTTSEIVGWGIVALLALPLLVFRATRSRVGEGGSDEVC